MTTPAHHPAIRRFATEKHYRPATIDRWLGMDTDDAQALLGIAEELRLGENQLRDVWDWADEIASRDQKTLSAVLSDPSISAARRADVSRNDRLKRVKDSLRRLRYPRLVETEQRLQALVAQLRLPRSARLSLPVSLEGDTLKLEAEIGDPAALAALAEALLAAAGSDACAQIFALLEEAP